jgi:chemotaxis family two-component system sensor kinase Cph1
VTVQDFLGKPVDLTNCDREPIHMPGSIQPHGMLLVLRADDLAIVQVAGDAGRFLCRTAEQLLSMTATDLMDGAGVSSLRRCVAAPTACQTFHFNIAVRDAATRFDAVFHRTGSLLILELEPVQGDAGSTADALSRVKAMLAEVQEAEGLKAFCLTAAEQVRRTSGFDRVMVYKFLPDESGVVIAESRSADLESYLGLHYPATDIPKQARELYRRNWLRLIADVDYVPAPLEPADNPVLGRPPDLSLAWLRSVSPIHIEYLRNMGVRASMSISIVVRGRLWGLIACHHHTPRCIPCDLKAACELFGQMFSLQLEAREREEEYEYRLKLNRVHEQLVNLMAREDDLADGLIRCQPNLLDYIEAGGVVLWFGGQFTAIGRTPTEAQIRDLIDWLNDFDGGVRHGVASTDGLAMIYPPAAAFADVGSGVLALSVSRTLRDYILWFRPELVKTMTWAGNPEKPVEMGPNGDRLTPRKSFEAWLDTVHGRSKPWTPVEREAAEALRLSLMEVVLRRIDQVMRERTKAQEHQDFLMAELDHRVKNTLANIQALILHTRQSAESLESFTRGLERRIRAMAHAHNLLTRSRWEGADLRSLAAEELDFYGRDGGYDTVLDGPEVTLKPKAALSISMALHELATNAGKYGALSVVGGTVRITWTLCDRPEGRFLRILWKERGGPPVTPPTRRGFGSTAIERGLAYELDGRVNLHFGREGVRCVMDIPVMHLVLKDGVGDEPVPDSTAAPSNRPSREPGILVVEDALLVVMGIEESLRSSGWRMVGPAGRLATALDLARQEDFDAALLDINIEGGMVFAVADVLTARGIPFVFATGYEADAIIPDRFRDRPVLSKPYSMEELQTVLRDLLDR